MQRSRGFTLIELLVVVALIAIAAGVATLALRDPDANRLDQEAVRLAALLESARAEARASGIAVHWRPLDPADSTGDGAAASAGFRFIGLPASAQLPGHWLNPGVSAEVVGARAVVLGPEPLIPAQRIVLHLGERRLALATDGLGPFEVREE